MSEPLTRSLGTFVSELRLAAIPADALSRGAHRLCRLRRHHDRRQHRGPAEDPATRRWRRPPGDATLYLVGPRVPAPEAAWINGTAAHALDYDDVALRGHPSTVLVPAILAEGQSLGAAARRWPRPTSRATRCGPTCSAAIRDQHHEKGWHPTGIFGAIGAAAACASLRGLDAEQGHAGDRARRLAERRPGRPTSAP